MLTQCPRCTRPLAASTIPGEAPYFCMYCGHDLRTPSPDDTVLRIPKESSVGDLMTNAVPFPVEEEEEHDTRTQTSNSPNELSGSKEALPNAIAGFRLLKYLGAGGMGIVYEAESPTTGERVAIKLLSRKLSSNPISVERFRQEGRLASQISHPRCVFVLRADTELGRPYIVMELMPGKTLKDAIDERGPLPVALAVQHILDISDGLIEAHRLGVIHRDIKPSNCFLTEDGRVKIGDFGLSKSLATSSANEKQLTHSGTFLGTVLFAPPEQIRHEPVGYDSDVYAVSATLYYLLLGRAPHQHESLTAVLAKAISEPAPPLRPKRPEVSKELERIILKGLERDRSRRYQSLEEFRDALNEQLPSNQQPAGLRSMILAYLIDCAILTLVFVPLEIGLTFWLHGDGPIEDSIWKRLSWVGSLVYFAVGDGLFGVTLGKLLLRLRVVRLGQSSPPGLWRGALRSVIYYALWMLASGMISQFLPWYLGVWGPILILAGVVLGFVLVLFQIRRTPDGNRGVHDYAAGTRTIRRQFANRRTRLISPFPNPLDGQLPATAAMPNSLGSFVVRGKVCEIDDGGEVWVGEDPSLGRRVIIRVEPPGIAEDSKFEEPVVRPTRLRAVGHGSVQWGGGERAWIAYVAPAGSPLPDLVSAKKPLRWADARPVLEQLTGELIDGEKEGSTPNILSSEQIWIEPTGRVQLLDFPLPTGQALAAGETKSRYPGGAFDSMKFLRQTTALMLEGATRSDPSPIRAPLPPKTAEIVDDLMDDRFGDLPELQKALRENRETATEVTGGMRTGHLTIAAMLRSMSLLLLMAIFGVLTFWVAVGFTFSTIRNNPRQMVGWIETPEQRDELIAAVSKSQITNPDAADKLRRAFAEERLAETRERILDNSNRLDRVKSTIYNRLNWLEKKALDALKSSPAYDEDAEEPVRTTSQRGMRIYAVLQMTETGGKADVNEAMDFSAPILFSIGLVLATTLVFWPVRALAFRGGISFWLAGVTLVRWNGKRAGRFRCALREILHWLPFTMFLCTSLAIQIPCPDWVALRTLFYALALASLVAMIVFGLRDPERTPVDRLLGTYLVPS